MPTSTPASTQVVPPLAQPVMVPQLLAPTIIVLPQEAEIELEELGQLQGKSKPEDQKDKAKKNRRKTKKQLEREKVRQREQEQERELQRERNRLRALEEAENGRSPSLMRLRSRRNSQSRLQDPEAGAAEFIRRRTKGRQKRAIKLFPGKYDMQRWVLLVGAVEGCFACLRIGLLALCYRGSNRVSSWGVFCGTAVQGGHRDQHGAPQIRHVHPAQQQHDCGG